MKLYRWALLSCSSLLLVAPSANAAALPGLLKQAPVEPVPGYVVDRSEFTTTARQPDGSFQTTGSLDPLNFKENGKWVAIQRDLHLASDGAVHPVAIDGDAAIPNSLDEPVEIEHDGHEVSLRLLGATGNRVVSGSTARFSEAISNVDVTYAVTSRGLKENVVLRNRSATRIFKYSLQAPRAFSAQVNEHGEVVLADGAGKPRFQIEAPLAWDSASEASYSTDLKLSVEPVAAGEWTVTMRPDLSWLDDPKRVYPVTLDPSISWLSNQEFRLEGASADCSVNSSAANAATWNSCAATTNKVGKSTAGNGEFKMFLRFNMQAAIPSNAKITRARVNLKTSGAATRPITNMRLTAVNRGWNETLSWNRRSTGSLWNTPGGDLYPHPDMSGPWAPVKDGGFRIGFDAPLEAVQAWADRSIPNYGFQLNADNPPVNTQYSFDSNEGDPASIPSITVAWENTLIPVVEENIPGIAQFFARETGAGEFGCDDACQALEARYLKDLPGGYGASTAAATDAVYSDIMAGLTMGREGYAWTKAADRDGTAQRGSSTLLRTAAPPMEAPPGVKPLLRIPAWITSKPSIATLIVANYVLWNQAYDSYKEYKFYMKVPPVAVNSVISLWVGCRYTDFFSVVEEVSCPPGMIATQHNSTGSQLWMENATSPNCNQAASEFPPAPAVRFSWLIGYCTMNQPNTGMQVGNGYYIPFTSLFTKTGDSNADSEGGQYEGWEFTQEEVEDAVRDFLEMAGAGQAEICSALAASCANPRYTRVEVPTCQSMTPSACRDALAASGIIGAVTEQAIPQHEADPDVGANLVTGTYPAARSVINTRAPVIIFKNPPTVTPYTSNELTAASALMTQNQAVVDSPTQMLTYTKAKQIVRACQRLMTRAVESPANCLSWKILVLTADVYEASRHDSDAIEARPEWALLHKRGPIRLGMVGARNWHTNAEGCAQSTDLRPGLQCDEFPYAASYEGWRGLGTDPYPVTRKIDADDNEQEGRILFQFYSSRGVGPGLRFAGCNLTQNPRPAEWALGQPKPFTFPPTAGSGYLLVPLPRAQFPSVGLCNGPTS